MEKWTNKQNLGIFGGPPLWRRDPSPRRGLVGGKPSFGFAAAKLLFTHGDFCGLFRFVISLLQGLVYWINEDPISV